MLEWLYGNPVLFHTLIVVASLFIMFKAADLLVEGISSYAHKLGLSDAIIGLVVVAMAASSPEIISSVTGFISGGADVGFGAIIGTNMVHIGFALGILALLGKRTSLEAGIFSRQKLLMWAALMLPLLLALDGELSRVDGVLLLIAFGLYMTNLWRLEGTLGKMRKNVRLKTIWRDVFVFVGCLAAILLAGRWLVFSSVNLARAFDIPAYFIALTVIGVGTTMPDIAVELRSLFKAHAAIGLGDLLGSLMIEFLLFFGLLALIKPLPVNVLTVINAFIFLSLSITTLMLLMRKKVLTWKHGLLFLGYYAAFIAIEIWKIA
ncbi:MAG: sodium:calcium antiporter [Candidatus Woesearchaeota archaeon]